MFSGYIGRMAELHDLTVLQEFRLKIDFPEAVVAT